MAGLEALCPPGRTLIAWAVRRRRRGVRRDRRVRQESLEHQDFRRHRGVSVRAHFSSRDEAELRPKRDRQLVGAHDAETNAITTAPAYNELLQQTVGTATDPLALVSLGDEQQAEH